MAIKPDVLAPGRRDTRVRLIYGESLTSTTSYPTCLLGHPDRLNGHVSDELSRYQ